MKQIPVPGPWITKKEIDYVAYAATHAWYENASSYNSRFDWPWARR